MNMRKLAALTLALLCLAAAALAENAQVQTPGGTVNLRKKTDSQSVVVAKVPNHALVEVLEEGDLWCRVRYGKNTGYIKSEFLLLPSALAGKTVYPDAGSDAAVRAAPDAEAALIGLLNSDEPLTVQSVAEGWAAVQLDGQNGFVSTDGLITQLEAPGEALCWIPQAGTVVQEDALPAGTPVTVCRLEEKSGLCVVRSALGWLTLPQQDICLDAYPDEEMPSGTALSPAQAAEIAETALKKQYKAFGKERMYCAVTPYREEGWRCGFFTDADQLLYGAVVDGAGQLRAAADYTGFAVPDPAASLLPNGEVNLTLSATALAVGDVLDITVEAWTAHQCQYTLVGPVTVETAPGAHFAAAYRPREAGEYTLTVTVTDEDGQAVTREAAFTVDAALPALSGQADVYSQKDGWWLDVPYRASTLDKSGCAIFTLSHALARMGREGEDLLPGNLARQYALCLTPDGTNNERLIREAAEDYGFATRSTLIQDAKTLAELLRAGAMFSFSIARGHIALACGISEDGAMVRVVDSAPQATFERIVNDSLYSRMRSGAFREVMALDDLPGARWYLDTDSYGGAEYWLRLSYVAKRGGRLIQEK